MEFLWRDLWIDIYKQSTYPTKYSIYVYSHDCKLFNLHFFTCLNAMKLYFAISFKTWINLFILLNMSHEINKIFFLFFMCIHILPNSNLFILSSLNNECDFTAFFFSFLHTRDFRSLYISSGYSCMHVDVKVYIWHFFSANFLYHIIHIFVVFNAHDWWIYPFILF